MKTYNTDHICGAGILRQNWLPGSPAVVMDEHKNARDPVIVMTGSGKIILAAESVETEGSMILVSRSSDNGSVWDTPRIVIGTKITGHRLSAGAAGSLSSGRLVLAVTEWRDRDPVIYPRDIVSSFIMISDDEGDTWIHAGSDNDGQSAEFAVSGRVFSVEGTDWLTIYGAADNDEAIMGIHSAGLMKSINGGRDWCFSHWIARADRITGIGYGSGEVMVLKDGQWLALLQEERERPSIYRTVSKDGGAKWSVPVSSYINNGTSTVLLDDGLILVGGHKDRGIIFTVGTDTGRDWFYQDQIWQCVWYAPGHRGGTRLLRIGQDVLAAYHWMGIEDKTKTAVRTQLLKRSRKQTNMPRKDMIRYIDAGHIWNMAEIYQIPDMPEAPAGIITKTILKLRSGDWICIGHDGTGNAYEYIPTAFYLMRSKAPEGPWKKSADIVTPVKAECFDTGTGAGYPVHMMQHSSGRLFMPFSTGDRRDIILTRSDDEGLTWHIIGSAAVITGMEEIPEADMIKELDDGSLIFPMLTGFLKPGRPLLYILSADLGETWSAPVFWAAHTGSRYEGLPYGRADIRESGIAVLKKREMIGIYRESRGTPLPGDSYNGPCDMPYLCLSRSMDGGRSWTPSFGFLGVEPDIALLPGGAVMAAFRDDNCSGVWISYDSGHSWQKQADPAEVAKRKTALIAHTQWPAGGTPVIRMIDGNTAAVICDTGSAPPGRNSTLVNCGRVQICLFRRIKKSKAL
jgi:hypothetical protein